MRFSQCAHAWRELDYFIEITGYAKYLEQRETVWFHAFFCLYNVEKQKGIKRAQWISTIGGTWLIRNKGFADEIKEDIENYQNQ